MRTSFKGFSPEQARQPCVVERPEEVKLRLARHSCCRCRLTLVPNDNTALSAQDKWSTRFGYGFPFGTMFCENKIWLFMFGTFAIEHAPKPFHSQATVGHKRVVIFTESVLLSSPWWYIISDHTHNRTTSRKRMTQGHIFLHKLCIDLIMFAPAIECWHSG